MHPEHQYLRLLNELLDAPWRPDRTGTGTHSVFGRHMEFDLAEGFPLLTTKALPFKIIAEELFWFLRGETNVKSLQDRGVTIWDEWADETGNLGPVYGKQWRNWWAGIDPEDYDILVDQVANIERGLREDPFGRRHVMTSWNVADIDSMALPPCHGIATQFYVESDGSLSCSMYQRSADAFLGLPFNIASYALLTTLMAVSQGLRPGRFIWQGGDVHLYSNHIEQAQRQLERSPKPFPALGVRRRKAVDRYRIEDLQLIEYHPHPHIRADVSV
jgi:thymidylate synthase